MDSRLNFSKHISEAVRKASKGLGLLKYLSKYVSRKVLDLSYKVYVRPLLDYGDKWRLLVEGKNRKHTNVTQPHVDEKSELSEAVSLLRKFKAFLSTQNP